MTSVPLNRRRLLTGSGAALGLAAARGVRLRGLAAGLGGRGATASASATASATPSATASPSPSAVGATVTVAAAAGTAVEAPQLAARLEEYLGGRSGSLGLELVDLTPRARSFRHDAREAECYSTIKVLILTTVLRQAQEAGKQLTRRQKKLAARMITRSDNAATETLLAEVGRDEVRRVAGLVGMEHTEIDEGWWGFWRTVPGDLNLMIGALLSTDAVLDGGRRARRASSWPTSCRSSAGASSPPRTRTPMPRRGEERLGAAARRLPAQLDRLGQRRRPRLRAQHPVQQPRRVPLRPADDLRGRRHLPRGARGPAGLTEPQDRGRLRVAAMTGHAVGRRALVVGGSAGLALGALGLVTAPAHAAGVDTGPQLTAALDRYMATRAGVAGSSCATTATASYFFWRPRTQQTHSTIKVLILVATLKVAQDRGRALTSTQKSLASRMIRYSDNAATDTLHDTGRGLDVPAGGRPARDDQHRGARRHGFRSSTWWGHSTTTTRDLVQLMNHVVLGTYLSPGRRAYVRDLMATVTSTQTWGLGDGLPDDVHVELKNGWGPRSDGYRLNCVGHVSGRGRSYQMSILSRSSNGYSYGQTR